MQEPQDGGPEAANIRFLRRMTTVLTGVMILGLLTMIALFVIRFWAPGSATPRGVTGSVVATPVGQMPALPETITLPEGETVQAVTYSGDRLIVVTSGDRVLFYNAQGTLEADIAIPTPSR